MIQNNIMEHKIMIQFRMMQYDMSRSFETRQYDLKLFDMIWIDGKVAAVGHS